MACFYIRYALYSRMLMESRLISMIRRYSERCQCIDEDNDYFFRASRDNSVMQALNTNSRIDNTISDSAMVTPKAISGV